MKKSSYIREFSHYTILSVLGTLGVSCYILADTFFVSKGLGTNGLTALNLAIPVYNFIHGTGLMLGMGGAIQFSICKGQGNQKAVDRIYTNTIYLAVLFSVLFMLPGIFCADKMALLLGADTAVLAMTETYLRWLLLFSPAFILNDIFLCFVRNDDSPQLVMTAMLTGSFANILLDYIFIFPMQMGIFGAIFATGLSPLISIAIMLPHWKKGKNTFHLIKTGIHAEQVRKDLSLGFPSLLAQISSGIVMIIFNWIILRLKGNAGVAAYGIIANISLVVVAVYTGIAQGVQPLISRFYAVGNKRQAQITLRYAMTVMFVSACTIYACLILFAQPLIAAFNSENNLELQGIAASGLKLYFISTPFVGYNIILSTFFTSIEKVMPAHILSLLRGFILIIPLAFLLSDIWGITGVWLAYPVTEVFVMLLGFVIYTKSWKGKITYET